jgi:23S rRNA (uridine2552-2'-O)-methyltransferase
LRKRRDLYTKRAKQEGYRSRAAYKLLQINKKFQIFGSNQIVIDLCGAPGGFSQVARDCTKNQAMIILIDIARVKPFPGVNKIIKGDITDTSTVLEIRKYVEKNQGKYPDLIILADCSPNVSGNWATDHARQIWLSDVALGISNYCLANTFLTKAFQGELFNQFVDKLKLHYKKIDIFKPPTSRKASAETYIVARKRIEIDKHQFDTSTLYVDEE